MARPKSKGTKQLELLERQAKVVELVRAGYSQRQVAARLSISQAQVRRDVAAIRKEITQFAAQTLEAFRAMEIDRLEQMQQSIFPRAVDGDLKAIDAMLRIMQRRAALLGLDASVRTVTPGGEDLPAPTPESQGQTFNQTNVMIVIPDNGRSRRDDADTRPAAGAAERIPIHAG